MSAPNINALFDIWGLDDDFGGSDGEESSSRPFRSYSDMYDCIDESVLGDIPWRCMRVVPPEGLDPQTTPRWKREEYEVWYRDPDRVIRSMLSNPDFNGEFDYAAYVEIGKNGKWHWGDMFSANFAWRHSVGNLDCVITVADSLLRSDFWCRPFYQGSDVLPHCLRS